MSVRLLNVPEAAALMRYSVSGLRKLLRHPDAKKRPPAIRAMGSGRILFFEDELVAWLHGQTVARPERRERRSISFVKRDLEAIAQEVRR